MPLEREALATLVARVATFRTRDRALARAQAAMTTALARGDAVAPQRGRAYLAAVRRYFHDFEREAAGRLADVERRLARANQLQFNLTAERGVADERVALVRGVLDAIAELSGK